MRRVVYDDNSGGRFAPCRGGFGAYGGIWFENIVSGISRDILVEAMFRIEAAGYPIVLHVHDELRLLRCRSVSAARRNSSPDDAAAVVGAGSADRCQCMARAIATTKPTSRLPAPHRRHRKSEPKRARRQLPWKTRRKALPSPRMRSRRDPQLTQANDSASISVSFTRFEAQAAALETLRAWRRRQGHQDRRHRDVARRIRDHHDQRPPIRGRY